MELETVQRWMEGYTKAWGTNERGDIGQLFTEDARYFTAPFREPWKGRDAIEQGWIDVKDEPGDWSFRYEILATADDLAFVRGWTSYPGQNPSAYSNLWVLRLTDDGRCSEFTEWWMEAPAE